MHRITFVLGGGRGGFGGHEDLFDILGGGGGGRRPPRKAENSSEYSLSIHCECPMSLVLDTIGAHA